MYTRTELRLKRTIDVVGSAVGLVVSAPILFLTAALVKWSSPGPVLFRQTRVGRAGQPFELMKFRTMRSDASGPLVTAHGDPRITPIGRVLRKTKLDELPELVNVLFGDLSLVGPRPEVPSYVALYPDELRRFLQQVRPGLTDPATVRFRNEEEILARAADREHAYVHDILPAKLEMYREYLESASLGGDLRVMWDTVRVVLFPGLVPG